MEESEKLTPMIRQYREIKGRCPDAILFYRIGDFYEMFFEDAITASKVLGIVLTSRNKNDPNPVPLCGVPYHSMQPYLEKLVNHGFKVAICDQTEDPKLAKGTVKREITRIVTPGLLGTVSTATGSLVAVHRTKDFWGIASLEVSTGDFRVTEVIHDPVLLVEELRRIGPREVLVSESFRQEGSPLSPEFCLSYLPEWIWEESYARKILYDQFGIANLSGFDCESIPVAIVAAGAALHYVQSTQRVSRLPHLTSLKRDRRTETLLVGEESRKNLSLDALLELIDKTRTAMGRRRLKSWFYAPLILREGIESRLDAVQEFLEHPNLLDLIQKELAKISDLEKITSRLSLATANARDLRALAGSLEALRRLSGPLQELKTTLLRDLSSSWDSFEPLEEEIRKTLVDDPPIGLQEGGLINHGLSEELDHLRRLRQDAKGALVFIEERERRRTGINSLKVQFNRVFGYYLEVPSSRLSKVPDDFIRKQTLSNAERFITPELKEFEDKVVGADGRIKVLEYSIFCDLRKKVGDSIVLLQAQAGRVADLDTLASLAAWARDNKAVRPEIDDSGLLEIREGRHPLVEANLPTGSFVPNDLLIDRDGDRLLIITGPNMSGKSTVIRQTGLIVLMAQAGSYVPAAKARIGIVDQLFTRVGAADRLARGESTFMVEMCETAAILHQATDRSLILLDEIGRGTSTFDGISIAWAVAEYLHDKIGARSLFATHYHELIDLALTRSGIKNYNVRIEEVEEGGQKKIVFLYRLVPGGMSHSFGLHVAALAGLPPEVLDRAKEILHNLEQPGSS